MRFPITLTPWLFTPIFFAVPPPSAAELTVRGKVTAGDRPPAEARVSLIPVVGSYAEGKLYLDGEAHPAATAETQPDARGYFQLTAPEIGMWTARRRARGPSR